MFEFDSADDFIAYYQMAYSKIIIRARYEYKGREVALLCVRIANRLVSLPYLSMGAVELFPKSFDIEFCSNIEIRADFPLNDGAYTDKHLYEFELSTYKFPRDIRRKINKSERNSINVRTYNYENSLDNKASPYLNDFYLVYSKRMREIGVPALSKKTIVQRVSSKRYILFIAYYNNLPIGASSLNLISDDYFENELFSTDSKYHRLYTSYALHAEMMRCSKLRGARIYSMGRSTKNSSVSNYKEHWNSREVDLYWHNSQRKNRQFTYKIISWFWSKLPYRLTVVLGEYAHRRIY